MAISSFISWRSVPGSRPTMVVRLMNSITCNSSTAPPSPPRPPVAARRGMAGIMRGWEGGRVRTGVG